MDALSAHFTELEERFGHEIGNLEATLNEMGYQYLEEGILEEAISVFKLNVERFPDSANVYDSIAGAYGKLGDLEFFRANVLKACEVGRLHGPMYTDAFCSKADRVESFSDEELRRILEQ